MASEVDAMGLLAQPTATLQIASAVASALDAPVRSGNASIARRLLASSVAYRMRVRKKLLRQMSGDSCAVAHGTYCCRLNGCIADVAATT